MDMDTVKVGDETPWGTADFVSCPAPGITVVSTPSHGGILLSLDRQQAMPEQYRGLNHYGGGQWYEEDCEANLVAAAFPDAFPHIDPANVKASLAKWYNIT